MPGPGTGGCHRSSLIGGRAGAQGAANDSVTGLVRHPCDDDTEVCESIRKQGDLVGIDSDDRDQYSPQ
ncbi:hypothetical protein GCM10010178_89860 [Lentzea flava]|uniref:Uncharacterized protein n=1 Tax=Lentzea flava TaxID=103732 RepID=A0ABQ2VIG2_9PSEU|nr:hypothetical protein GCM10010178_89860 [Lentzea flava]